MLLTLFVIHSNGWYGIIIFCYHFERVSMASTIESMPNNRADKICKKTMLSLSEYNKRSIEMPKIMQLQIERKIKYRYTL